MRGDRLRSLSPQCPTGSTASGAGGSTCARRDPSPAPRLTTGGAGCRIGRAGGRGGGRLASTMIGTAKIRESVISSCFKPTVRLKSSTPSAVGVTLMAVTVHLRGHRPRVFRSGPRRGPSARRLSRLTSMVAGLAGICGMRAIAICSGWPTVGRRNKLKLERHRHLRLALAGRLDHVRRQFVSGRPELSCDRVRAAAQRAWA